MVREKSASDGEGVRRERRVRLQEPGRNAARHPVSRGCPRARWRSEGASATPRLPLRRFPGLVRPGQGLAQRCRKGACRVACACGRGRRSGKHPGGWPDAGFRRPRVRPTPEDSPSSPPARRLAGRHGPRSPVRWTNRQACWRPMEQGDPDFRRTRARQDGPQLVVDSVVSGMDRNGYGIHAGGLPILGRFRGQNVTNDTHPRAPARKRNRARQRV